MEVFVILNDFFIDFFIRYVCILVYRYKIYLFNCLDVEIDEVFFVLKYISEICIKDYLFDLKLLNFNKKLKKLLVWWEFLKGVLGV